MAAIPDSKYEFVVGARFALKRALSVLFASGYVERAVYEGVVTIDELVSSFRKNLIANTKPGGVPHTEAPAGSNIEPPEVTIAELVQQLEHANRKLTEAVDGQLAEKTRAEKAMTMCEDTIRIGKRCLADRARLRKLLDAALDLMIEDDD